MEIPENFFGKFVVEKSENFDEYLKARGLNWFLRKLICFTSVTKIFSKGREPGRYNLHNLSSKENTSYEDWALGETFQSKGLDSTQHKITFNLIDSGTVLTEHHVRLNNPDDKGETYYYSVEDNKLVLVEDMGSFNFINRIY